MPHTTEVPIFPFPAGRRPIPGPRSWVQGRADHARYGDGCDDGGHRPPEPAPIRRCKAANENYSFCGLPPSHQAVLLVLLGGARPAWPAHGYTLVVDSSSAVTVQPAPFLACVGASGRCARYRAGPAPYAGPRRDQAGVPWSSVPPKSPQPVLRTLFCGFLCGGSNPKRGQKRKRLDERGGNCCVCATISVYLTDTWAPAPFSARSALFAIALPSSFIVAW